MKRFDEALTIGSLQLKNRLVAGPMGNTTNRDETGIVSDKTLEHLTQVARGGAALILQGATSVTEKNKAHVDQTGIWSDAHGEALKKIPAAVHQYGAKIILQLEHAGFRTLANEPMGPVDFTVTNRNNEEKHCHAMCREEFEEVKQQYTDAAKRAVWAGYDGIELHAGHGWLLSEFLNKCINTREDRYGQDPTLFIREIYEEIRKKVPENFVIGIRLGVCDPEIEDGIRNGRAFEKMGFDYLDVSNNLVTKWLPQNLKAPDGYPLSEHVYTAGELKKAVSIPVIGGKQLRTAEEISLAFELTDLDMITLGRPFLADPEFANKILSGEEPNICRHCKGRCPWTLIGQKCAARAAAANNLNSSSK